MANPLRIPLELPEIALPTTEDVVRLSGPLTPDDCFHVGLDERLKQLVRPGELRCEIVPFDSSSVLTIRRVEGALGALGTLIQLRESNTNSPDGKSHDAFREPVPALTFDHEDGRFFFVTTDEEVAQDGPRILRKAGPFIVRGVVSNIYESRRSQD